METSVKVSSTWQPIQSCSVKVASTWESVRRIYAKVAGTWEMVWQALGVTFPTITLLNTLPGGSGTCVANVVLDSDGDVYTSNATGTLSSAGTWLDDGLAEEVWTERSAVSGDSLASDPWGSTGARRQMNIDRAFGISQTGVGTTGPTTFTISWYDAASGGNLLETTSVSLTATVEI